MRGEFPEADHGSLPPRLRLIAALGNGGAPNLKRRGYVEVAAHLHFAFTARNTVSCVRGHRLIRGRRFEPPARRHLMSEGEAACRAAAPCADPPALRDELHRGWTATFPCRDRNAWAPRSEAAQCDEPSDSDASLLLPFMQHNDCDQRPPADLYRAPRAQNILSRSRRVHAGVSRPAASHCYTA